MLLEIPVVNTAASAFPLRLLHRFECCNTLTVVKLNICQ